MKTWEPDGEGIEDPTEMIDESLGCYKPEVNHVRNNKEMMGKITKFRGFTIVETDKDEVVLISDTFVKIGLMKICNNGLCRTNLFGY